MGMRMNAGFIFSGSLVGLTRARKVTIHTDERRVTMSDSGNGEKKWDDIGALWEKTSSKGQPFMAGNINGQKVVIFKVENKRSENQPDWRIYPSRDREEAPAGVETEIGA
jgi:uncharacterized protein (DUF736 family)